MSSGLLTQSKFNTVIRYGTTEKVATEPPSRIFAFMPLPSAALGSTASFFLCMDRVSLEMERMLRLLKLMTSFKCGPTKVGGISLGPQSL
jgi:hypothetical protein